MHGIHQRMIARLLSVVLFVGGAAWGQGRFMVYEVATPSPTREVELLLSHRLSPVEPPPWGGSVHVVGTAETERELLRVGAAIRGKSDRVPFRWLRPDDVAEPVALEVPAPRLSAAHGYHGRAAVERLLLNWTRHYPDRCALYQFGASLHGAPMLALRISDHPEVDEDEPAVLFGAGIHASELFTVEVALDLAEHLILEYPNDPEVRRWVDGCDIWIVPIINPDGNDCAHHYDHRWRKNARGTYATEPPHSGDGVDLNRNFPVGFGLAARSSADPFSGYFQGTGPASEPETQAMLALAESRRFALLYTYHTAGGWVLYPYSERSLLSPSPNYAEEFARALGAKLFVEDSTRPYRVATEMYPVAGVDQDTYYYEYGTFAYIIEVGRRGGQPELARWREPLLASVRPSWRFALDALTTGPRLWGHVRDAATGAPLPAVVAIKEQALRMNERWTAHPRTGRFDRLFVSPTTVTLVARLEGYEPQEQRATVTDGPVQVEFRLRPVESPAE
ncbi:hypothetical protein HS125_06695 [bacterium]|nr:hypothetical protein [bacterium]